MKGMSLTSVSGRSECCSVICGASTTPIVSTTTALPFDDDCLKERRWWCFLLSSIFTFIAGLLIVLLWRVFAFLCCKKEPELSPNDPKQKEQKAARQSGKQEFEGTFMTEAKDWAGELISGQTTTGRILVRPQPVLSHTRILNTASSLENRSVDKRVHPQAVLRICPARGRRPKGWVLK